MNPPKRPSRAQLDRIVQKFNATYPVGTEVMLRQDFNAGEIRTRVRGPAIVMQGHSAVCWFENVSGCYSIEDGRVRPVDAEEPCAT